MTAVLNVSDSYAPAAWAPVVKHGVVLAAAVGFVLLPGPVTLTPTSMTTAQILVLGIGTTAGIGAQAAWTVRALRRTGFRWSWRVRPVPYTCGRCESGAHDRLDPGVCRDESGRGGRRARVAFSHDGVSTYTYADLLFQMPYGVLAVSLLTVLMPRIARAVAEGDRAALIDDMGRAARYSVVALVPARGCDDPARAGADHHCVRRQHRRACGPNDRYGVGIVGLRSGAFALVMLQMRVFYAGNDMRTPALINIAMVSMKIAVVGASAVTLPSHTVVVMLPVAGSLAYVVGVTCGHLCLRRRYGPARVPCGGRDLRQGAVGVGGSRCLLHRGGRFGTPADRRSPYGLQPRRLRPR
ncbi:hypothetical protein GS416_06905 [Rhodococcus hoagii]|nr:hypothetical protein [Prescottella equi]